MTHCRPKRHTGAKLTRGRAPARQLSCQRGGDYESDDGGDEHRDGHEDDERHAHDDSEDPLSRPGTERSRSGQNAHPIAAASSTAKSRSSQWSVTELVVRPDGVTYSHFSPGGTMLRLELLDEPSGSSPKSPQPSENGPAPESARSTPQTSAIPQMTNGAAERARSIKRD